VLALLAERPMHGYEMLEELEERTGGAWTPSAGSIYPTLQMLEDADLIRGEETDGKRRFTLTDGKAEQKSRSGEATPWELADAPLLTLVTGVEDLAEGVVELDPS
jgi:DNA-binding PadR family transcriptional regulator